MDTILLRPAGAADRAAIARIWHASAGHGGAPNLPSPSFLRERVEAALGTLWPEVTVAEEAGEVVAFLALAPARGVLEEIFVQPDRIGQGLGRRLLDLAKRRMPGGFTLYTWAQNAPARAFYERAGLVLTQEGRHPERGHPVVHYAWTPGG
ncbi:GNAT family N-acetyltransferase [Sinirhodobacter huangdaonensis]|uniref:N-acetyltransferase n=1 Tax=Paenirhodobacter huangdaonensis TaxID=2501515 RepID=A0A443LNN7_9RHOB|nr:GNAT family N-acetyltransferase [Sinirhodobacter huangdaonensis]RWR50764.1 N-acetyltransferase [Sinirhodobacter huangdaonensis]